MTRRRTEIYHLTGDLESGERLIIHLYDPIDIIIQFVIVCY